MIGDHIPLSEYQAVLAENRQLKRELAETRKDLYEHTARRVLQGARMKNILDGIEERRVAREEPQV